MKFIEDFIKRVNKDSRNISYGKWKQYFNSLASYFRVIVKDLKKKTKQYQSGDKVTKKAVYRILRIHLNKNRSFMSGIDYEAERKIADTIGVLRERGILED